MFQSTRAKISLLVGAIALTLIFSSAIVFLGARETDRSRQLGQVWTEARNAKTQLSLDEQRWVNSVVEGSDLGGAPDFRTHHQTLTADIDDFERKSKLTGDDSPVVADVVAKMRNALAVADTRLSLAEQLPFADRGPAIRAALDEFMDTYEDAMQALFVYQRDANRRLNADSAATMRRLKLIYALGPVPFLGIIVLLAIYTAVPFHRNIRFFLEAAEGVSRGDFTVRVPESGSTEVVRLAKIFNVMCSSLEKGTVSRTQLEELVQERTREHERAAAELDESLQELKRAQDKLLFADRMSSVGQMAAGVAHEINNPLAFMIANLAFANDELSARASGEERQHAPMSDVLAAIGEAKEGAEKVSMIVRDLKAFSRVDEAARGPVDVRHSIRQAVKMASNEIRHRAQLVEDYQDVGMVEANEGRLGQVFINLLVNAAQAIPAGNLDGNSISISVRSAGESVVVEIKDTGAGMPPEVKARIFDPFFTTKPVGVGTGLGLSVCVGLISSLGGTIEVESEVGQGSLFRIALPMMKNVPAPPPLLPAPPMILRPTSKSRLLMIDDEPKIGASVRRTLSATTEVIYLNNAKDALNRLMSGETFDLILCDLMMPGMGGMELHQALATLRPGLESEIIFMTGGAFTPEARAFLDSIPNIALDKPFDPNSLRALVQQRITERAA